jgi:hypothetical protein
VANVPRARQLRRRFRRTGAALAAVELALARGLGANTYGSLVTIAADPERAQDLRLRAVDALGGFERGRLTGRFLAGPRVQVASDVAVPPRVRAHVVDRLQSLAEDRHGIVAERARAALVR